MGMTADDARTATLTLLGRRTSDATLCPSEVARALADADPVRSPEDWRDAMPVVHAAIDRLMAEGLVRLSWKGEALTSRTGPYRIRAADE